MKVISVSSDRQLLNENREIVQPTGGDVLVKVKAVSVNPIDLKRVVRVTQADPKVLGYDGIGRVVAVGERVSKFSVGDQIYYAGDTTRDGSYAEYQLVDEQIAALAPSKVSLEEAVALPLTWLTAYEILVDKLNYQFSEGANSGKILVINAAGGAGSIFTQLAKWMGLTVVATSSANHFDWLRAHGVDVPIDYHSGLLEATHKVGVSEVDSVVCLYDPSEYFPDAVKLLRPFGHFVNVVRLSSKLDLNLMQSKSQSFDWELMFTKSGQEFNPSSQGVALAKLTKMLDDGVIKSTLVDHHKINFSAENISAIHQKLAKQNQVGKTVVEFI